MSARASVTVFLAALSLVACGGTSGGAGSTMPHSRERPPYTACDDAAQVRLAPTVCWNPTGSHWQFAAEAPGGALSFEVELMAGGRVRAGDVPNASPAVDEWFVENDELRIFLQNRYVEYRATLHNGTMMIGEAVNVRGDVWAFSATRVHEGATCPGNELATTNGDEPGCFDVAGSRWTLSTGGREYEIQFADGGTLLSNDPSDTTPDDDGWEQDGATVRLWFDGRATELSATISPSDLTHLSGSGHAAGGAPLSWTGTAIPTYPPPIH
jgi:hypothetical protein